MTTQGTSYREDPGGVAGRPRSGGRNMVEAEATRSTRGMENWSIGGLGAGPAPVDPVQIVPAVLRLLVQEQKGAGCSTR